MAKSHFTYVTYIRTTPEKLWAALTQKEFSQRYWVETWIESTWAKGAPWKMMIPDGRVADAGEVLEIDRPKRLVISWRNEFQPHLREEGFSRATFELDAQGDMVKLTVTHEMDKPNSKLIAGVSGGWPMILASLKSLLETGESLAATRKWPEGL
jgi:uncharacterized protein YndB with AHSA1/START domain